MNKKCQQTYRGSTITADGQKACSCGIRNTKSRNDRDSYADEDNLGAQTTGKEYSKIKEK